MSRLSRQFENAAVPFELVTHTGATHRFGKGEPRFTVTLKNRRAMNALMSLNQVQIGDAFVEGGIDLSGDMLGPFALRDSISDTNFLTSAWAFLQPLVLGQVKTNRRVIATHYDLDAEFFLSFLDPVVPMYTQGIYLREDETLATTALRKFEWCVDHCHMKPGDRILEIGPGWGGLAQYSSKRGVHTTGLTISPYSLEYMNRLKARDGGNWDVELVDCLEYQPTEIFDAIVIMGVIEHLPDYKAVLERFSKWVKPGGRIFLDGAASAKKFDVSTFIKRHVYGGNHSLLVLHDFLDKLAATPLKLIELHNDRLSYFYTAREWGRNFEANRDRVVARFGEYNFRRFELFLWGAAYNFGSGAQECYRMILERPA